MMHVWDAIPRIEAYILRALEAEFKPAIHGTVDDGATLVNRDQIHIGAGTRVEAGAYIAGPAIIGERCDIRHTAYIRGSALIGDGCVVGHASELKNSVMMNGAHAAHFAYLGDSILGNRVNLGAGTKLSNLTLVSEKDDTGARPTIGIAIGDKVYDTGLSKFGCVLGDDCQTGCNCVVNPGTLVGPRTLVYANVSLAKGCYAPDTLIKLRQQLESVPRR